MEKRGRGEVANDGEGAENKTAIWSHSETQSTWQRGEERSL